MPMTPELRRGIDRIRDHLFGGGYPNPAQNAEQLSFLIYFYMHETADAARVRAAKRPGAEPYGSVFDGEWILRDPRNASEPGTETVPRELLRWSSWAHALNGERLVNWVREEVFAFHAELSANGVTDFMDGARLVIDEPTVLTQVVSQLNDLHLDRVDSDTKGDLFEHVLRQIRQAGELGQFRTPRHVIRALVRLVDPRIGETIYDPAAGTAGFLAGAWDHVRLANSSPDGIEEIEAEGKTIRRGLGDTLSRDAVRQLQTATFHGADVDPQMVRLATMNLTLRGLDRVRILRRDALTRPLDRAAKAEIGFPAGGFDVILANPPFSGRLDRDRIVEDVKVGNTAQTELLFLQYMLNHLKSGGRCGVVVPEGVLFGDSGAHKELRRKLVENNTIEAILSLPSGVFNPYSPVKTSVLVFRKGGATERVMFLHADNDGYKLDAKHDQPIEEDDLPRLIDAFRTREARLEAWLDRDAKADWTDKWWFAESNAIRAANFNLSANRYRPQNRTKVKHRDPLEILEELRSTETEVLGEIDALAEAVRESLEE
ncbi:MAG: N-6 DNA methylase [Gammaproteobacteria bacterium]|nr:N-6 DNA methylase [Boseongicola sp. SB0675_bin_26]MYK68517.1 N-6 DNA methylase [Gammaproteobacteria bacterium]